MPPCFYLMLSYPHINSIAFFYPKPTGSWSTWFLKPQPEVPCRPVVILINVSSMPIDHLQTVTVDIKSAVHRVISFYLFNPDEVCVNTKD